MGEVTSIHPRQMSYFCIFGLWFRVKPLDEREVRFFFGLLWGRRRLNLAADLLIF
jgi:hypothetical protein